MEEKNFYGDKPILAAFLEIHFQIYLFLIFKRSPFFLYLVMPRRYAGSFI